MMTAAGVREALASLPTFRWAAAYVAAYVAAVLLTTTSRVSGPLLGAAGGYLVAGPFGALLGLLIGGATQTGPVFSLVSALLLDGAARLATAVNRAAATAADLAAQENAERETAPAAAVFGPLAGVRV